MIKAKKSMPLCNTHILVRISIVIKIEHNSTGTLVKEKHLVGDHLQFQKFSPLSLHCDMMVCRQTWYFNQESYVMISRQQEVVWNTGCYLSIYETWKFSLTVTHFLQQCHINPSNATPPNSATFLGLHFLSNHYIYDNGEELKTINTRVQS